MMNLLIKKKKFTESNILRSQCLTALYVTVDPTTLIEIAAVLHGSHLYS